jgi:heme exporter protein CcmD
MSHDFYLWMSYGAAAVAVFAELVSLKVGRAKALRAIEEERELETQD